tara:strand:+ start:830 stop:1195 length:366 start_codon:yes stop_codon:yes gene_type:complete
MKKLLAIVVVGFILSNNSYAGDCSGCVSESYDAYRDARKAYRASNLSDCQKYAKRAYRHLSYAESEASDCGCSNAEYEAYDGYRDARRAYKANSLSDCKRYAKKAYRHASYAEDYASSCSN